MAELNYSPPMRFVLACLAVLALAISPLTAAAAQAACNRAGPTAMPPMPSMDQSGAKTSGADPCCDHGKKSGERCAQACALSCGVTATLTDFSDSLVFAPTSATLTPLLAVSRRSHEPPGLRRPPKSIA